MRCGEWIAVAGDAIFDTFEWHDGEGNFGRCLKIKSDKLKEKASKLADRIVVIKGYYPKGYEKSGELGVLVDIREATEEDFERARFREITNMLEKQYPDSDEADGYIGSDFE